MGSLPTRQLRLAWLESHNRATDHSTFEIGGTGWSPNPSFFFFLLSSFIYFVRDRNSENGERGTERERERERESENPKWAPCCQCRAQGGA